MEKHQNQGEERVRRSWVLEESYAYSRGKAVVNTRPCSSLSKLKKIVLSGIANKSIAFIRWLKIYPIIVRRQEELPWSTHSPKQSSRSQSVGVFPRLSFDRETSREWKDLPGTGNTHCRGWWGKEVAGVTAAALRAIKDALRERCKQSGQICGASARAWLSSLHGSSRGRARRKGTESTD